MTLHHPRQHSSQGTPLRSARDAGARRNRNAVRRVPAVASGAILAMAALACACSASAADVGAPANADGQAGGWTVRITPYAWFASVSGHASINAGGPRVQIHNSISDVLDQLEVAGFVRAWAQRDRLVLSADMMYVRTDEHASHGTPPLPGFPNGVTVNARAGTQLFNSTLMGGWRVADQPGFKLDVLAGARYWYLSSQISATAGPLSHSWKPGMSWVDPLIAANAQFHLGPNWSVQALADVGGFNVGSDQTWSVEATLNYRLGRRFTASAGYRMLDVDYDQGGNDYHMKLKGPVLGLTYWF